MQKYFDSHYHIASLIFLLIINMLFFATYVDLSQTIHIILLVLILFVAAMTLYFGVQVGLIISLIILFVIGTSLIAVGLRVPLVNNISSDTLSFEMFVVFGVIFLLTVILAGLIHLRVKAFFAEREQLQHDLNIYTSMDVATSFGNKHRLHVDVKFEMERVRRHNGLFTMLFLELDHFKEFEQTYGAAEVLHLVKSIGQKINDATRSTDRKYRFESNKFGLLFFETKKDDVELILDKLAPLLQKHQLLNKKFVTLHYHISYEEFNESLKDVVYEEFIDELERELILYAM